MIPAPHWRTLLTASTQHSGAEIVSSRDTENQLTSVNFRVDISLLHAKWLLEKKQYPEALMFDQLRKVMGDPKCNPLPGFEEADITFMPTFKYDVWKSVRATNKEKRKSIRRSRRTSERSERPSIERPSSPTAKLDFVPEIEGLEESSDGPDSPVIPHSTLHCSEPPVLSPVTDTPPNVFDLSLPDDTLSLASRDGEDVPMPEHDKSRDPTLKPTSCKSTATYRSERSDNANGNGNGDASVHSPTPPVPAPQELPRRTSVSWSRKSRDWSRTSQDTTRSTIQERVVATTRTGQSLKAKTQKLMGILRLGRKPAVRPILQSVLADEDSVRRASLSSRRSYLMSDDGRLSVLSEDIESPAHDRATSPSNYNGLGDPDMTPQAQPGGLLLPDGAAVHRTTSAVSTASVSVGGKRISSPPRRPSSLMRSLSGLSLNEDAEEGEDCTTDTRTGVYDTSKKQRVPSWCDRVLWKTHVIPDPVENPAEMLHDSDNDSIASSREGPLLRLSHVFSSLSGRMRRRSSFLDPGSEARPAPLPLQGMSTFASAPNGLVAVAPGEVAPVFESDPPTPADEMPGPADSLVLLGGLPGGLASPLPPHILSLSSPARKRGRSVTFEAPAPLAVALRRELSPQAEEEPSSPLPPATPNGAAALGLGPPPSSPLKPRRPSSSTEFISSRIPSLGLGRRMSMSSIGSMSSSGSLSRRRSEDPTLYRSPALHQLKAVRSTGHSADLSQGHFRVHRGSDGALGMTGQPQSGLGALTKFFRELPGRFQSRVNLFQGSEAGAEVEEPVPEPPKRHLVGEVQVLHYGTIDDAGMRQLEGRSDHRPAIFSAAVYI